MVSCISDHSQNHPSLPQFGLSLKDWAKVGTSGLMVSGSGVTLYGASSNVHNMTDLAQKLQPFSKTTVGQTGDFLQSRPPEVKNQPLPEFLGVDIASSSSKTSFITSAVGIAAAGLGAIGRLAIWVASRGGKKQEHIEDPLNLNPFAGAEQK